MNGWSRRNFVKTTAAAGLALPAVPALAQHVAEPAKAAEPRPRSGSGPGSDDDPLGIRGQFPVTEELAYLNTASTGPAPLPVREALVAYADEKMTYRDPGSRGRAVDRARSRFASLFGADEAEIAFLFNTSDGENVVANGIDWRPGDNVVIDELHFTTAFVVYRELEKREGVELRIIPSREGRAHPEDYDAYTDDRTRLVSVAWVSNRNGFRHDLPTLAEIAHARGGYLFADGIQAFGTFPTDLHAEGVDFACGNGYKWLHADFGCSILYARSEHHDWMQPDRFGHAQVAETLPEHQYRLRTDARKFEHGSLALGPVAAMDAALGFIGEVGLAPIAEHTHALAGELREGAAGLGMKVFTPPANPSPIVSFYHGMDSEELADALNAEGVRFTYQEGGELLRAAVAMFNNRDDVDRLLGVLAARA